MGWRASLIWAAFFATATAVTAQSNVTTSGGTTNTIPVFTGSSTVGNSPIAVSGSNVGIGTNSPTALLNVYSSSTSYTAPAFRIQQAGGFSSMPDYVANFQTYGNRQSLGNGSQHGLYVQAGWSTGSTTPPTEIARFSAFGSGYVDVPRMVIQSTGNVGIGTTSPTRKLHIAGDVQIDGNLYFGSNSQPQSAPYAGCTGGDYAESMDVSGDRTKYASGDVLVLDPDNPGKILKSIEPYSTAVAGVYSTRPGYVGRRQTAPRSDAEVPMAMVGVAPTKVTAENGAIKVGDLLVSSSTPGYAMKGTDRNRMLGAVIGKAMGTLDSGSGTIDVLVTLQ